MMTEGQVLISDPAKVVWGHPRSQQFCVDILRLRRDRDMKKSLNVFVSSIRIDSYATWVTPWPWPEVKFWPFNVNMYVSMRLDERNTMTFEFYIYCAWFKTYQWKKKHGKKRHFYLPWHLEANVLTLRHIWWEKRRSVSWAIFCFFVFGAAIIVLDIVVGIPDNHNFSKIWPLMTSANLNIHLSEKWPKWLRTGSLRGFDGRIARSSSFSSFRV